MRFFSTLFAVFALMFLLLACSANPHKTESVAFVGYAKIELPEPEGAAGKSSWTQYKFGMQALEGEDPLTAAHYLDLALDQIYSEQQLDSLRLPKDSVYFSIMPMEIILALESLYPTLITQASPENLLSMRNDYEDNYESLEDFEETPLDSAEKIAFENFLDAIDLSKFSLPVVINDRVLREIHYLTVNARTFTESTLSRKTILDSMIYSKLAARGMPEDLIYLAFVESGFKTSAYSRAKAAGVWQFIPATGKRYGLPVDFWLDMRRNPEAATDAALNYLSALYKEFGDWHLAMAAYNCGEGRIRRLVREGAVSEGTVSYWDLQLPRETMHYVPRILAAAIIGHFPEHYSFKVEKQKAIPSDTVTIKDCIPLDRAGAAVGVNVNTMRDLNPELIRWCTPPNLKSYTMKVPKGTREKFLEAYAKMDKTQLVRWQQYKVQKGDNLGYIAKQFGLKVSDIQAANNLKNSKLSIGQVLIIPMPVGVNMSNVEKSSVEKINVKTDAKTYVIRKGDNLSSISRRFGISSQNLMEWNGLQSNRVLVGQRIYLQNPVKREVAVVAVNNNKAVNGAKYEIKSGDNLWDIAKSHNVTVQQLLEWNPGLDKKIFPGMKIKVSE